MSPDPVDAFSTSQLDPHVAVAVDAPVNFTSATTQHLSPPLQSSGPSHASLTPASHPAAQTRVLPLPQHCLPAPQASVAQPTHGDEPAGSHLPGVVSAVSAPPPLSVVVALSCDPLSTTGASPLTPLSVAPPPPESLDDEHPATIAATPRKQAHFVSMRHLRQAREAKHARSTVNEVADGRPGRAANSHTRGAARSRRNARDRRFLGIEAWHHRC
jgi:hypothetical protein